VKTFRTTKSYNEEAKFVDMILKNSCNI